MIDPAKETLRLRVFAGPNGSGKSTVINHVKELKVNGQLIDFGTYINADDIKRNLDNNKFSFNEHEIPNVTKHSLAEIASASGLINETITLEEFKDSFSINNNHLTLINPERGDRVAQIIADYIRKRLLQERRKFSFETVFSHESKLETMKQAREAGYKVYLYFVCTENPFINIERVKYRASQKGHNVPEDRIISRYFRALELLHDAAQLAYQAFFFDNSKNNPILFAHFKMENGQKKWDNMETKNIPLWFYSFYLNKVKP